MYWYVSSPEYCTVSYALHWYVCYNELNSGYHCIYTDLTLKLHTIMCNVTWAKDSHKMTDLDLFTLVDQVIPTIYIYFHSLWHCWHVVCNREWSSLQIANGSSRKAAEIGSAAPMQRKAHRTRRSLERVRQRKRRVQTRLGLHLQQAG